MSASLYWLVLELSAHEPAAAPMVADRGIAFVGELLEHAPDASPEERALLVSIAHHESRWLYTAIGDKGKAWGAFELHPVWRVGVSRAAFFSSARVQIRLALSSLRSVVAACGGPALRFLGAYAGGTCGGAVHRARELCAPASLCDWSPSHVLEGSSS